MAMTVEEVGVMAARAWLTWGVDVGVDVDMPTFSEAALPGAGRRWSGPSARSRAVSVSKEKGWKCMFSVRALLHLLFLFQRGVPGLHSSSHR